RSHQVHLHQRLVSYLPLLQLRTRMLSYPSRVPLSSRLQEMQLYSPRRKQLHGGHPYMKSSNMACSRHTSGIIIGTQTVQHPAPLQI
ncbi:hypothetical protein DXG03_006430, partial [Asterophora parasitica]